MFVMMICRIKFLFMPRGWTAFLTVHALLDTVRQKDISQFLPNSISMRALTSPIDTLPSPFTSQ